jgi:hypothetical protein
LLDSNNAKWLNGPPSLPGQPGCDMQLCAPMPQDLIRFSPAVRKVSISASVWKRPLPQSGGVASTARPIVTRHWVLPPVDCDSICAAVMNGIARPCTKAGLHGSAAVLRAPWHCVP